MPKFLNMLNAMDSEGWRGYASVRNAPVDESAMLAVFDLLDNKARHAPHKWEFLVKEAVTTADFPVLFGGVLDRELMARYAVAKSDWREYIKVGTCNDFRTRKIHKVQGLDDRLPVVPEKGEYLVTELSEASYGIAVKKHGRQFDFSWESLINDNMGALSDVSQRFADAAVTTENYMATSLYAAATGPNPLLFGAPITDVDGQQVTNSGTLNLTIKNLEATLGLMAAQTDLAGRPLGIRGAHLVVPPLLEMTARAILTSALVNETTNAGAPMPQANVLSQLGIKLHVDPLLPVIDTTAGQKTWYVFADLSQGAAAEIDFLRGHETPDICMKSSNKVTSAGLALSPFAGDFETDNVMYRVRHILGGAQLDPRMAYAQVGRS